MTRPPSKKCIVCGRRVPRRMVFVEVSPPSNPNGTSRHARVNEDLRSLADCQRHTNLPFVVSARRDGQGFVRAFNAWDGESYMNGGFFCTNRCAQDQGYASAAHGDRYTWKRGQA